MKPEGRRAWIVSAAAYLVVMAAALSPLWLRLREPTWDARDMGYPAFAFLGEALKAGHLPLWDPYSNCGYPFFADPSHSVTNPVALLLGAIVPDPALGFALFWCFHWILGGAGMFLVVRALGGGPGGGFVSAILFALSGFFVGHGEHTLFLVNAAWLPWAVGFAHLAVARRRRDLGLAACAALGMTGLGGYPALVPIGGLFVAAWLGLAFLLPGTERDDGAPLGARARWVGALLAGMAAVVAIAASPMLYAFFREGAGYTSRVGALAAEITVNDNPFPPSAWLTLLFPHLGIVAPRWIGTDYSMSNGYAGILALPLALLWITEGRSGRRRWWLLGLAATFLVLSAGGALGLRWVAHYAIPVFRFLRHNGTLRLYWILPIAAAAGCGASLVAREPAARRRGLLLLAGWGAVALIAATVAISAVRTDATFPVEEVLLPLFGPGALVLGLGALALALWPREGAPSPRLVWALSLLAVADGALHLRGNSLTVWAPPSAVLTVDGLPRLRRPDAPRATQSPFGFMNAHLVLGVPVVGGYVTMKSDFESDLLPSRFAQVLAGPRFWLVPETAAVRSRSAALEELRREGAGDAIRVFAEEPEAGEGSFLTPGSFGATQLRAYAAERVELDVLAPTGPAFLASTERISAGWRVAVDGVEATPVRTNLFFRGVRVPAGRHRVAWWFDPGAFPWLLAVAYAVVAGCALAAGGLAQRAARPVPAPAVEPDPHP